MPAGRSSIAEILTQRWSWGIVTGGSVALVYYIVAAHYARRELRPPGGARTFLLIEMEIWLLLLFPVLVIAHTVLLWRRTHHVGTALPLGCGISLLVLVGSALCGIVGFPLIASLTANPNVGGIVGAVFVGGVSGAVTSYLVSRSDQPPTSK